MTGGTRGIGAAIVKTLLAKGYRVTSTGTTDHGSSFRGATYLRCDFSNPLDLQHLADRIRKGGYSILVNNAGINKIGALETYALPDYLKIQHVNVTAPFVLCQAAIPFMRRKKFGRIVNISSIFGVVSRAQRSAYSASKSALIGLTRALALEVAKDNVLINGIAPGFVDTDLTRASLGVAGIRKLIPSIPQGRLARPEEIASFVSFLASRENSYMTGQTVMVDGGFTCA